MSSDSRVSATIREMARLRNHLWLEGITNQGACSVLHLSSASSKALLYSSQNGRSA